MEKIAGKHEWSRGNHSSENPVSVRALRVECVHALIFERRHHVALNRWDGHVKAIAQVSDVSLGHAAGKQVLHQDTFEWREISPLFRTFELNKDVVLLLEDDELRDLLFTNLDVSAHREVHKDGGDVAWIGPVVDERPDFCRTHSLGRLIHWSHRKPSMRISPFLPPKGKHDNKCKNRQQDDRIASNKPRRLGKWARRVEDILRQEDVHCEPATFR